MADRPLMLQPASAAGAGHRPSWCWIILYSTACVLLFHSAYII